MGWETDDKEREKPGKWRPGAGAGGEPRGGRIGCGRAFPWAAMWLNGVPRRRAWLPTCRGINHAGMLLSLQWQCFPLFRRCEPLQWQWILKNLIATLYSILS